MKIIVKSFPENFTKEKSGIKSCTVRELDGKDTITIINTETEEKIVRKITDISIWKGQFLISFKDFIQAVREKMSLNIKQIRNKIIKEKTENRIQRLREILFETGRTFRDKTMKEFGYTYNQSWLLFDEDELSDLIDLYEELCQSESFKNKNKLHSLGKNGSHGQDKKAIQR